jgi:hypothetical protein
VARDLPIKTRILVSEVLGTPKKSGATCLRMLSQAIRSKSRVE